MSPETKPHYVLIYMDTASRQKGRKAPISNSNLLNYHMAFTFPQPVQLNYHNQVSIGILYVPVIPKYRPPEAPCACQYNRHSPDFDPTSIGSL